MKKIGQNIRKLRELRNLTQQYMADQLQMTQGNYARIENEEINISDERIDKISTLVGFSREFIVQFNVDNIHDHLHEKKEENPNVVQYQISPELKQLYEDKIQLLENIVTELKIELREARTLLHQGV